MMTMQKLWSNVFVFLKTVGTRLFEGKKNPFLMLFHPVETMEDLKQKKNGSVVYATLLLIAFTVMSIIQQVATGFLYSSMRPEDFNIISVLCSSGVLVLLFVVGNWALCTLLNGEGRIIDIYIMTCYNLTPLIIGSFASTFFSGFLLESEYVFVNIFALCMQLWFICLMIYGVMTIHNYSFWATFINLIASLVAMAVIFFLVFLFVVLMQQLYVFFFTIFTECRIRYFN